MQCLETYSSALLCNATKVRIYYRLNCSSHKRTNYVNFWPLSPHVTLYGIYLVCEAQ